MIKVLERIIAAEALITLDLKSRNEFIKKIGLKLSNEGLNVFSIINGKLRVSGTELNPELEKYKELVNGEFLVNHSWIEIGDFILDPARFLVFEKPSILNVFKESRSEYISESTTCA